MFTPVLNAHPVLSTDESCSELLQVVTCDQVCAKLDVTFKIGGCLGRLYHNQQALPDGGKAHSSSLCLVVLLYHYVPDEVGSLRR